jgi:hypothetical protein
MNVLLAVLPVLPVSEVWNMGYSAPWTLLDSNAYILLVIPAHSIKQIRAI